MRRDGEEASIVIKKARLFRNLFCRRYPALRSDSEDFFQFCVETMLRRKTTRLQFLWLATDFLESRQCFSTENLRYHRFLDNLVGLVSEIPTPNHSQGRQGFHTSTLLAFFSNQSLKKIRRLGLDSIDRSIVLLTLEWGFSLTEIASLFGLTQGVVTHRLKKIKQVVAKHHLEDR